jgi:8-oxo-dGTP diphosphatase
MSGGPMRRRGRGAASAAGAARAARGPAFPCARCGRPVRRTAGEPPRLRCPRCRYLIYDYPRSCGGIIVRKGDAVLLLRRAQPPRKGWLDVPGGFLEANESIEGGARRELREETGLTLGPVQPLGLYWDRYFLDGFGWFPTMNFYFIGRWRRGEPRPADDAAAAEWVPLAHLGAPGARYAWTHMRSVFRDLKRLAGGARLAQAGSTRGRAPRGDATPGFGAAARTRPRRRARAQRAR